MTLMIPTPLKRLVLAAAATAALTSSCSPPDPGRENRRAGAYLKLLAAEDARPDSGPDLATLIEATGSSVVLLRRTAVRALGRLEDPDLVDEITALLDDPVASVRSEAANALAQAVHRSDGDVILGALLARAEIERDSLVLSALARSLGRSSASSAGRARTSAALLEMSRSPAGDAPLATLVGVTLGFESLVRRAQGQGLSGDAAARLVELGGYGTASSVGGDEARVRSLALSALGQSRRLDRRLIERIMRDPDVSVRLVAARHLDTVLPGQRPELIRRLLGDLSVQVPLEAMRQITREPLDRLYCGYLLAGSELGVATAVRVAALGALGRPCPQAEEQRQALVQIASGIELAPVDGGTGEAPEQNQPKGGTNKP